MTIKPKRCRCGRPLPFYKTTCGRCYGPKHPWKGKGGRK